MHTKTENDDVIMDQDCVEQLRPIAHSDLVGAAPESTSEQDCERSVYQSVGGSLPTRHCPNSES
eukprot:7784279-Pyramimonas_sp.AAC.1